MKSLRMIMCLQVAVLCCSGLTDAQPAPQAGGLSSVAQEWLAAIDVPKPNAAEVRKVLLALDTRVSEEILNLFRTMRDLDAVRKNTEGIVVWCEWPHDPSGESWATFMHGEGRDDKRLRINYRKCTGPDGANVYLLQNSYWNKKYMNRTAIRTYSIILDKEKKVSMASIRQCDNYVQIMGDVPSAFVLGIVPNHDGWPDIVMLDGPVGQGLYSTYCVYSYDATNKAWNGDNVLATERSYDFRFDERMGQLEYERVYEDHTSRGKFLFCGKATPLLLRLSTVGKGAEVKVSFTRSDKGTSLFRLGSADESVFLSGRIRVTIRTSQGATVEGFSVRRLQEGDKRDAIVKVTEDSPCEFAVNLKRIFDKYQPGKYRLSIEYVDEADGDAFSGWLKSNTIDVDLN